VTPRETPTNGYLTHRKKKVHRQSLSQPIDQTPPKANYLKIRLVRPPVDLNSRPTPLEDIRKNQIPPAPNALRIKIPKIRGANRNLGLQSSGLWYGIASQKSGSDKV